jgi:hypothetical protein
MSKVYIVHSMLEPMLVEHAALTDKRNHGEPPLELLPNLEEVEYPG